MGLNNNTHQESPQLVDNQDKINVFDEILKGAFKCKDVTLDVCNISKSEHGQYIELEFTYKGQKTDFVMQTGNLLYALKQDSKNDGEGIPFNGKEGVAQ